MEKFLISILFILFNLVLTFKLFCNDLNKFSFMDSIRDKSFINLNESFLNKIDVKEKNYERIEITNKNFSILPDYIFQDFCIEILILEQNEIEYVSNLSFSRISKLNTLSLKLNKIKSITEILNSLSLSDESTLQLLDLSSNNIDKINVKFLRNFENLINLDLQSNKIESIGEFCLENLKNLKELRLNDNRLKIIQENTFFNLKSLFIFDLSNNRIVKIEKKSFKTLINLKYLHLDKNRLNELDSDLFENLTSLTELILNKNKLSNLRLNGLYLLENLDLNQQNFVFLDRKMFQNFINLNTLNLKYNSINTLESYTFSANKNLEDLDLKNSEIKFINENAFYGLSHLNTIYLDYNLLTELNSGMFNGLKKLDCLNLNSNLLNKISKNDFINLKNLQFIGLNFNMISVLEQGCFKGLYKLLHLYLKRNSLKVLKEFTFSNLTALCKLDLSSNKIKIIEENAFFNLVSLEILNLSENKLENVKNYYFNNLKNLKYLYLTGNRLLHLEGDMFKKIDYIDLSYNCLNSFNFIFLQNTSTILLGKNEIISIKNINFRSGYINELNLSSNKITELLDFVFESNCIIDLINLANNGIRFISENLFNCTTVRVFHLYLENNRINSLSFLNDQFSKLYTLNLADNLISRLYTKDFENFKNLRTLDLSNNPILNIESQLSFGIYLFDFKISSNENSNFSIDFSLFNQRIHKIDLGNCQVENLNYISNLKNLGYLYLRNIQTTGNEEIEILRLENSFIYYLDLSFNSIKNIQNLLKGYEYVDYLKLTNVNFKTKHLLYLTNLNLIRVLILDQNSIEFILKEHFSKLNDLKELDLSFNLIDRIEAGSFVDLTKLRILNLKNNNLKLVYFSDFYINDITFFLFQNNQIFKLENVKSFQSLAKIDFSNNNLKFIDSELIFEEVNPITSLNLSNNLLTSIDENLLKNCYLLEWANFEFNNINHISPNAFERQTQLVFLSLSNNNIKKLDANIFKDLVRLEKLNLSSNNLVYIISCLFINQISLKELDLSNNSLKSIGENAFSNLRSLNILNLAFNFELSIGKNVFKNLQKITDIFMPYNVILKFKFEIKNSFLLENEKQHQDLAFLKSVYFNYFENVIDCKLILEFAKWGLNLNLKRDNEFDLFYFKCYLLDLK